MKAHLYTSIPAQSAYSKIESVKLAAFHFESFRQLQIYSQICALSCCHKCTVRISLCKRNVDIGLFMSCLMTPLLWKKII